VKVMLAVRMALRQRPLACLLLGYFVLCGVLLPWFLHRVGPDAASYITIARKYRLGTLGDAINGYWSPLLSWLLAPCLLLGAPSEVTARFLQVAIGGGSLAAVWWLGTRLQLSASQRLLTTSSLIPAVATYALTDTTPDLLVAGLLALYVGVVVGAEYPTSPRQSAACGLLGGLAYLAKAYAFPFFLTHFVAVSGYLMLRRLSDPPALRRVAVGAAAGLLVFALVAGSWAGVISRKYSRLTIGTTGSLNLRLGGGVNPTETSGLFPLPNETAISAWEDPSNLRRPSSRPVAEAAPNAGAWTRMILSRAVRAPLRNSMLFLSTLSRLSPAWPLILLGLLLSCRVARGSAHERCMILLGTLLIYPSGYLLIFIQSRFFWIMTFLLAASAGLAAATLPVLGRRPWYGCWAIVTAISFMLWPAWLIFRLHENVLEETPAVAALLTPTLPPGTRIASDQDWGITNAVAYYLGARYYGSLRADDSAAAQEEQLREHRIQYILLWGDASRYPFLAAAREVPLESGNALGILRLPRLFELPAVPEHP